MELGSVPLKKVETDGSLTLYPRLYASDLADKQDDTKQLALAGKKCDPLTVAEPDDHASSTSELDEYSQAAVSALGQRNAAKKKAKKGARIGAKKGARKKNKKAKKKAKKGAETEAKTEAKKESTTEAKKEAHTGGKHEHKSQNLDSLH